MHVEVDDTRRSQVGWDSRETAPVERKQGMKIVNQNKEMNHVAINKGPIIAGSNKPKEVIVL